MLDSIMTNLKKNSQYHIAVIFEWCKFLIIIDDRTKLPK